ncbi:MAG: fliK [Massilia sp.]|nr:fliK [Massilia sp.]
MTIAVSVPLVPSRTLRRLVLGFAAVCMGMAAALASGWLGPSTWPAATATLCLLAGLALAKSAIARLTARTLDVCGPGRLTLTVQQEVGTTHRMQVRLLAESTLWPGLLVLRFDGAPALVLFGDSVPAGQFRRLAVALRAVASKAVEPSEKYYKNL